MRTRPPILELGLALACLLMFLAYARSQGPHTFAFLRSILEYGEDLRRAGR